MTQEDVTDDLVRVHLQILSLQLTWNCNAACRQCMVSGKERRGRVMSFDDVKRLLDQVQYLPFTRYIGFTGGEVFTAYDLLLHSARYVREKYGYNFGIATNCFWATDTSQARALLSPLVDAGLSELLVSLDDFHLEWVEPERIENCVNTALDLGIDVSIQTIKTTSGHTAEYFQKHMNLPRPPQVRWVETPCHPAGRAVSQVPASEYICDWTNRPGRCTALRVWNVDPYGWVTPCCGTAQSRRLRVGNAFQEDLSAIINTGNADPLLNTIAAWGGPYLLIKHLEQEGNFAYSTKAFASHCHACDVVMRDRRAVESFDRLLPAHRAEAVASRLLTHELWYRSRALKHHAYDCVPKGWLASEIGD